MTVTAEIPDDLCPFHRQAAVEWKNNDYSIFNPQEWPHGLSVTGRTGFGLMDSRTTHAERSAHFDRKNTEQVELIIGICRSGRSPQCTTTEEE